MSKKSVLLIVGVVLVFCGRVAMACSCAAGGPPCQAFGSTEVVFVGTPIELSKTTTKLMSGNREYDYPQRVYTFRVEEAFRGIDKAEVQVITGNGGGDCGYDFRIGERYIVYAGFDAEKKVYGTSICTRTRPISEATDDLEYIRSLSTLAPGAMIFGSIHRHRQNLETEETERLGPVADIDILVEGAGKSLNVRTDAQGQYRLSGLAPGKYKVTPLLPQKLSTYDLHQETTLRERGCSVVSFNVTDNGRIAGRVLDANGQSVPRIMLNLIPISQADSERPHSMFHSADSEGRFELKFVPPGRYLLGIRLNGLGSPDDPEKKYPRAYYPGVTTASEAIVIDLGESDIVKDIEFRLPPRLTERVISGKVVLADGRPASSAMVAHYEAAYPVRGLGYAAQADEAGQFRFTGYEGIAYYVSATTNGPNGRQMHAEPVDVPTSGTVVDIVLVISEPNGTCQRCLKYRYGQNKKTKQ